MVEFHMHRAAQDGDVEKIKHFIKWGISVDSPDDDNYTPLHWAAKCGHQEVAEFLLSQKADLDLKAKDGSTAVLLAAESGHRSIVELLLRKGSDAGGYSEIGRWTLLHYAARGGWTDTVKCLLEAKNTELDAKTTLYMTPLLLAVSEEHTDVIELLIEAGADVHYRGNNLGTVLHFAVEKGRINLIKKIVDVDKSVINKKNSEFMTPLLLAAASKNVEAVEILIEAGADIHVQDRQLGTLLHYAAGRGWLQIVRKILKIKRTNINIRNNHGNTPLHIACGMNNSEIIKELLKAGADANIKNNIGETAFIGKTIHEAAASGDMERLKCLIKLGVSPESRNCYGYTPMHSAAQTGQLEVGNFLIQNNCSLNPTADGNYTPLSFAALYDQEEFVALLIKSGADVRRCDSSTKTTILHTACGNNWVDIIQSILEKKNVNIEAKTDSKSTPLLYAVEEGHLDATKLLLQAGANVHSCNEDGNTALHFACSESDMDVELVKTLLLAGADPNLKNSDGETAFHDAIEQEEPSLEAIKLLIQHRAYFRYSDSKKVIENNPLKELLLNDVDLCTQLIINKFNRQSLPTLYKNPEYVEKLPRMYKMNIGNTEGVGDGIAACVQSEIQTKTYCDVMNIRPTALTLMCVEALINPQPIKKKISRPASNNVKGPVKRSARLALLNERSSKKKCSN